MKDIIFKSIHIQNFKGVKDLSIDFDNAVTTISGMNATGKTTIVDAISWILFDKDSSGNSKFELRPLDLNGNKIHHIDISVELTACIDGVDYTLSKVQKEKWVKKRGQQDAEYSGNVNEFSVNGFPKSSKDFAAFISGIINEKYFSLLTNPTAFTALDWKEQRKILMDIVGEISGDGLADEVEYYNLLEPELKVASIYDIKAKWQKSRNELKKKPDELQARIDEVSNSIVPDNSKELTEKKNAIKSQLDEIESKIDDLNHRHDGRSIDGKIAELSSKQNVLLINANSERVQSIKSLKGLLDDLKQDYRNANYEVGRCTSEIDNCKASIKSQEEKIETLKANIKKSKKAVFPESKGVCVTCGQKLPAKQYEIAKSSWEQRRTEYISKSHSEVKELEDAIIRYKESIKDYTSNLVKAKSDEESLSAKIADTEKRLHDAQSQKELTGNDIPEWVELQKQIAELEASKMPDSEYNAEFAKLNDERQVIEGQYQAIYDQLATIAENTRKTARVNELTEELRAVGQKISDCDRMLFAVESYNRVMAKRLSEKFSGLEIKLFREQVNGGSAECCELCYNGVPYGSLNTGHRIVVGLGIIKVLREYFDISVPVFIDNAEGLSSNNIPVMDGQMILMKVTDDPILVVN